MDRVHFLPGWQQRDLHCALGWVEGDTPDEHGDFGLAAKVGAVEQRPVLAIREQGVVRVPVLRSLN